MTLLSIRLPLQYTFLPAPYKSYGAKPCLELGNLELVHKMVNASVYSFDNCLEQCLSLKASEDCECYTPLLCELLLGSNLFVC